MRLHQLTATAFGPFATTVEVDFDELARAGLFLLTGDTGAGKTSVLDAVCFALYGEVPGERSAARHLRSDQAAPETAPRVVLDLSVGARRFRFTRSPAWDRPKRRGTGTTRVQAHAVVEEHRADDDTWVPLTHRLDEAGQLVTGLLGMTCSQFTQVVLLPQGRFQAFLRATSAERHGLLQRLFATRRFEDAERWLGERRVELRHRCRTHHDATAGVVNRLQEAAGATVPEDWSLQDLDAVAVDGRVQAWATGVHSQVGAVLADSRDRLAEATRSLDKITAGLDHARSLAEARARGESAQRVLQELEETAERAGEVSAALAAHRRATAVEAQGQRVRAATRDHDAASARAVTHVERAAALLGLRPEEVRLADLAAAVTRLTEERAVARAWLPREQQVDEEHRRVRALEDEVSGLEVTVAAAAARETDVTAARERTAAMLEQALDTARRAGPDREALEVAVTALDAAQEAAALSLEVTEARHRLAEATATAQDLRQAHLDLREQRISGMAAELAGGLAAGCSCPVCGSVEHPALATASSAVSRADEDDARARYESADFERQTVQELVATVATRLQSALVRSGGHAATHWQAQVTAAESSARISAAAEHEAERLRSTSAELTAAAAEVHAALAASRVLLEERSRALADVRERHRLLATELDSLLTRHPGCPSVTALVEAHEQALARAEAARAAVEAADRAAAELTELREAAQDAAVEAGFDSVDDALSALLPTEVAAEHAAALEDRQATRTAATAVLTEDEVVGALAQAPPDVAGLTERLVRARAARDQQHVAHEHAATRLERVETLAGELASALADWSPVREQHALAAGLASLVEGTSADNRWKMRLSAYVLSERLRQVVSAANERLATMTDQRFALEQADARGAGEQRGGLSLRVRDAWSGALRDPATLSGGETFIVSLALALGLADTVSHEAGGTQLDTLFVDEGFGALDATTLDSVMDTLDSLRDGGRVVGLVSHVTELRNRVPSQLEVRKARQGSSVRTLVVDH